MPNIQVKCVPLGGPQARVTPGQSYDWLGGPQAEGVVAELHGKYYQQSYNQRLWSASIATAAAIPISSTTAPTFAIWNPQGNPFAIVPVAFILGYTGTTGVAGAIGYYYLSGIGSDVATGGRVTAFTAGTIQGAVIGQTYSGQAKFGTAATITAGALHRWSQFSEATPATNTTIGPYVLVEQFDGNTVIPPNTFWYPAASAATGSTYTQTLVAYEVPWP